MSGDSPDFWEEYKSYTTEQRHRAEEAYRHTMRGEAEELGRLTHEIIDPIVTATLSIVNRVLRWCAQWLNRS